MNIRVHTQIPIAQRSIKSSIHFSIMDGIPFELLDPCCQKDILERRRNKDIKDRLSTTDPSLKKERHIESVFNGLFKVNTCHTCGSPKDYALLTEMRHEAERTCDMGDKPDEAEKLCGDSGDELLDDEFESDYELELKAKLLERSRFQQSMEKFGLGIHSEDSVTHIMQHIESGARVIVHIYDPNSVDCAKLDLSLESAAKRYLYTRFRRATVFTCKELCVKYGLPMSTQLLACFIDNSVSTYTAALRELVPNGEICSSNLYRYLENSKAAVNNDVDDGIAALSALELSRAAAQIDHKVSDGEEEDDLNDYCDEPGCDKRYSHTHIGASAGRDGLRNPFSTNIAGSEALGKNYFGKL